MLCGELGLTPAALALEHLEPQTELHVVISFPLGVLSGLGCVEGSVTNVLGSFPCVLLVPEPTKTCPGQPQPAGTSSSTSTSTLSSSSNGKRASAGGQQPAASRYLPREVPPRFRQQEQKQLLKRGQPLPTGALTSGSPTQGAGPAGLSPPPLPGAGAQQHPSKPQAGKPRRTGRSLQLRTAVLFSTVLPSGPHGHVTVHIYCLCGEAGQLAR